MGGNLVFPRKRQDLRKWERRRQTRFYTSGKEKRVFASQRGGGVRFDKWKRNTGAILKKVLFKLYTKDSKSMQEIADVLGCSLHKVAYWMEKHQIRSRARSEAMYLKYNPNGDPFSFQPPTTVEDAKLFGSGLGLYWGEGTKANKNSIRLGNTDPKLIKVFIIFLERIYRVNKNELRFGLQIFSDISPKKALWFWCKELRVNQSQFQKVVVTPTRGSGTYKKKLEYGVLTVYYNNTKLRHVLGNEIEKLYLNN